MAKNNEKPKIDLGARFIAARKAAGIKQYALAKMLGVSEQTVRNWEHNRAKCTKHEHLAYYSKISGFSIDYLQGLVNDPHGNATLTFYADKVEKEYRLINYLNSVSPYTFKRVDEVIPIYIIYDKETNKQIRKLTNIELLDYCRSLNNVIMIMTETMIKMSSSRVASDLLKRCNGISGGDVV